MVHAQGRRDYRGGMSSLTYMDCWNFIAPLIPVTDDISADIYVMVFSALKQAEERRKEGDKHGNK